MQASINFRYRIKGSTTPILWELHLQLWMSFSHFIVRMLANWILQEGQALAIWMKGTQQSVNRWYRLKRRVYRLRVIAVVINIRVVFIFRTGVQQVLPTATTVNAAFKRERRVLIQMVVLVVIYILFWMPFWTLYTWVFACFEIYWKHYQSGVEVNTMKIVW